MLCCMVYSIAHMNTRYVMFYAITQTLWHFDRQQIMMQQQCSLFLAFLSLSLFFIFYHTFI